MATVLGAQEETSEITSEMVMTRIPKTAIVEMALEEYFKKVMPEGKENKSKNE